MYWAAHQQHREVFVGWPTAQAIWGQRFVPGFLDHYLARVAWDGQMLETARNPKEPIDLYEAVPGHQGAHGAFDNRSRTSSWEVQLTTRASWVATAASALAGSALRALTERNQRARSNGHLAHQGSRNQASAFVPAQHVPADR
ncbi:MAG: hypothetical protein LC797_18710 [Chloroflexi bacterium]|nr:hypothetical protein [Chloroflexota bacterium]